MEWLVKIIGDNSDLEKLSKSLNSPELCITRNTPQEDRAFILKSKDFVSLNEACEVMKKAKEILDRISGAARLTIGLQKPLKVGVVHRILDNGKREAYIVGTGDIRLEGSALVEIVEPDGTVRKINPADRVPELLKIALHDENVAKVLHFLSAEKLDWRILYNIYDAIRYDVGDEKSIINKGWATRNELEIFRRTADSYEATGIESRHGKKEKQPPRKPMTLSKAESLIKGLAHNWLKLKN